MKVFDYLLKPAEKEHEFSISTHRIRELDGIRGVAVLMVCMTHAFSGYMRDTGIHWTGVPKLVELVSGFGWSGVDLFFVLSGFLITGILLEGKRDQHFFRNFYMRRALRIIPLYYLVLALILIFRQNSGPYVALCFVYLSNVTPLFGVAMLCSPLWSLAVEEHFYLMWPWIVRFASARTLAMVAVAICLLEPLIRAIGFLYEPRVFDVPTDIYMGSWYRFDAMACGALLVLFVRSSFCNRRTIRLLGWSSVTAALTITAAGLPFGILYRQNLAGSSLLYSCVALFFLGAVALVLGHALPLLNQLLIWRPLRRWGDLSYCIYLFHTLLFGLYDLLVKTLRPTLRQDVGNFNDVLIRTLVVLGATYGVAALSMRFFEGPILGLKKYFPSRTARPNTDQFKDRVPREDRIRAA